MLTPSSSTLVGICVLHITYTIHSIKKKIYISRNLCVAYNDIMINEDKKIYISRNSIVVYNIPGMLTPSSSTLVGIFVLYITFSFEYQQVYLH